MSDPLSVAKIKRYGFDAFILLCGAPSLYWLFHILSGFELNSEGVKDQLSGMYFLHWWQHPFVVNIAQTVLILMIPALGVFKRRPWGLTMAQVLGTFFIIVGGGVFLISLLGWLMDEWVGGIPGNRYPGILPLGGAVIWMVYFSRPQVIAQFKVSPVSSTAPDG
ncbi:MAG: hypothetical protein HY737_08350 [Candidatus Omnitrophica bacterium]|nr:hypothetical protein [Candidatus Omnitrophota bacterium]